GLLLWDRDGKQVGHGESLLGHAYILQFTPDGRWLLAGCEEGIMRWDMHGDTVMPLHAGTVYSLAVHRSGRLLATAGRQIDLWALNTNRLIASYPAPAGGATVEFSADGEWLLAVQRGVAVVGWQVT